MFPAFVADIDLPDVEDQLEDAVAELGRETEQRGELLIAFEAVLSLGECGLQEVESTAALGTAEQMEPGMDPLTGRAPGCFLVEGTCAAYFGSCVGVLCLVASWERADEF